MSVYITYFVHGTTTDNENNISSGWSDVALSALWIQQSITLAETLKDTPFDVVFCSDLQRAVHSAELAFKDIPIIADKRLRECNYGDYNAHSSDIVEPLQEQNITSPFPNGESYEDVKERIISFLSDIKGKYDGKRVALVWHKAPQLALDVILLHKTREEAFANDRRKTKARQPGREYILN